MLGACDDDGASPDAAVASACGAGPPTLALGVDRPFRPNPSSRFPLEHGLQGGLHLDVSLELAGTLDADDATVALALRDGDWLISEHTTAHWLLDVTDDGDCEYPKARLVLLDREGGLFAPARAPEVLGRPLALTARVDTPLGSASAQATITLYEADDAADAGAAQR